MKLRRVATITTTALATACLSGAALAQEPRLGHRDPLDPTGPRTQPLAQGQAGGLNAFNPAISVIFDGLYYWESDEVEAPAGFGGGHHHHHGHGHDHAHGELEPGFNLRETELVFQASIDNYLDGILVLSLEGTSGIEVEEAYATTRALPAGLQLKFGRFLSDVGYINRQHPHDWDFVDRPLVNELLFGDHGLQENGVQLSWVPATPFYSRFGIEVLQGETSGIANHVGAQPAEEGTQRILRDRNGPRLFTGFAKFAPNLGYDHALQIGLFGGYARSYQYTDAHSTRHEDWDGDAWFAGTDWVYRYDAGRSFGHGDLRLQAEYVYREIDFDRRDVFFEDDPDRSGGPFFEGDIINERSARSRHDGIYLQAVYGIAPRWSVGARYDGVGFTNSVDGDSFHASHRYAANVTFTATEFSRFRLQVNHLDFEDDDHDHGHGTNQVFLQYILSLGAHGAHAF